MMYLALALLLVSGALGDHLLTKRLRRTSAVCCHEATALTCDSVDINLAALGQGSLELPGNVTATFVNIVPGNENSYHYAGSNADIVVTYSPRTGGLFGHVATTDGRSFVLENCGKDGHVYREVDVSKLGSDDSIVPVAGDQQAEDTAIQAEYAEGSETTFSIKVYYTQEFADITPEIEDFIDQVIAETNQGYKNSQVNLKVVKHCTELSTVGDGTDMGDTLDAFLVSKSSVAELRGTADAAALLTSKVLNRVCGVGYLNTVQNKQTVSLSAKECALGYFTFGHEIGHNIGLHHNRENANNEAYAYGHGHWITQGEGPYGLRTIMAYQGSGYDYKTNYYSNPNVIHPTTKTVTGIAGLSDNARLLNEKAASLALIGDESGTCANVAPTTATTASTTPTQPKYCGKGKSTPKLVMFKSIKGTATPEDCQDLCREFADCDIWRFKANKRQSRQICALYANSLVYKKGSFTSGKKNC